MKAQHLRLTNRTKEPNVRKGIPNVLLNYLFETFSDLPTNARIDFIVVIARIHFKTNQIELQMISMNRIPYYFTYH